jgi:mutator protein MutT
MSFRIKNYNQMRNRATAVIIKDNKILLIKRIKNGSEYFIFPGGGVEEGETVEQALKREVKEELSLDINTWKHLYDIEVNVPPVFTGDMHQKYFIFIIDKYQGIPEIGGPEKDRISEDNQYFIEWMSIGDLKNKDNIYPVEVSKNLAI